MYCKHRLIYIDSTLSLEWLGVATWTKHFRNGVELPEIARDDNYDFNFQVIHMQFNLLCLNSSSTYTRRLVSLVKGYVIDCIFFRLPDIKTKRETILYTF